MVSDLIRVGLVVLKRSFAFLIDQQLATLHLIIIVKHILLSLIILNAKSISG